MFAQAILVFLFLLAFLAVCWKFFLRDIVYEIFPGLAPEPEDKELDAEGDLKDRIERLKDRRREVEAMAESVDVMKEANDIKDKIAELEKELVDLDK